MLGSLSQPSCRKILEVSYGTSLMSVTPLFNFFSGTFLFLLRSISPGTMLKSDRSFVCAIQITVYILSGQST